VGFLKFLKRDKGKEPELGRDNMEDLDVPPPPPDFEGKDLGIGAKELPELPELPDIDEGPISSVEKPLPKLELPEEKPFPDLEIPKDEPLPDLDLPPLPDLKLDEGTEPELPQAGPEFGVPKPRPIFGSQKPAEQKPKVDVPEFPTPKSEIRPYERLERSAVREEYAVLRHKEAKGPFFIRVERFKDILTGTRTIRNNLKIAGQSIAKMNEIDADRDKVLEKFHNVMMDLQKKLIFIDKTLFKKGDKNGKV